MKRQLTYEELKSYATITAHRLLKSRGNDVDLVAISRGGLTYAQLLAYKMAKPLSVLYPSIRGIPFLTGEALTSNKTLVFIEDVVAKGRTYEIVSKYMLEIGRPWLFLPVVVDANIDLALYPNIVMSALRTSDWIVFPHEDFDEVDEGDHGMFREGTSNNSKPLVGE